MTAQSTARRERRVPAWARVLAATFTAVGSYCLGYHFVFWFMWRFLFGEEVWPWPGWSLWLLVALPACAAVAAALFMAVSDVTKRNAWIAAGIGALALLGLLRYAGEVWKVMFALGFKP